MSQEKRMAPKKIPRRATRKSLKSTPRRAERKSVRRVTNTKPKSRIASLSARVSDRIKTARGKTLPDRPLDRKDLSDNPIRQFELWYKEHFATKPLEPTAMAIATANERGVPSVRYVLLKEFSENGFVFVTNYKSRKGRDVQVNPRACLLFYWAKLNRQVRISGRVELCTPEESDRYHSARPRESQLSAWSSHQSEEIADRSVLEENMKRLERQYEGREVPRPPHWGGVRVIPDSFEFWQGRKNRLHDRFEYTLQDGTWRIRRLAP